MAKSYRPTSSVVDVINRRIIEHYLAIDDNGYFVHPPSNDDELDSFIKAAYGITLPKKVITPGHKTPFQFVSDLFFERVKNALGFASRSAGKTYAVALLNHLDMLFKPGCEIASAGAVKDQAEKCYRYFSEFCELDWFKEFSEKYQRVTGRAFYGESLKSRTEFGNHALLEVITGSEKGLRGPHPHKARIDEIDLVEWSVFQTGLSMAHSDDTIRGQNVFTSTRQYAQGTMQRLLDEAHDKGISVYEWNIWETLEQCSRRCQGDPEHGTCPIYTFCRGKAHSCDGFFRIDDFIEKVRLLDRESFETEWINSRPSRHKLVYHMFDSRHVLTPDLLFKMHGVRSPKPTWARVSGLDFGSSPGHPFVYLKFCQMPGGAWLLMFEYAREQALLCDHAEAIKKSPFWLPSETIYADWDAQDRKELAALGIRTKQAVKGASSVNVGVDFLCSLLRGFPPREEPCLYIWHECKFTLLEWGRYSWPVRADGTIDRSGNPEKRWDNTSDAARMALYSHRRKGQGGYTMGQVRGI
jgi:hypothetical protein